VKLDAENRGDTKLKQDQRLGRFLSRELLWGDFPWLQASSLLILLMMNVSARESSFVVVGITRYLELTVRREWQPFSSNRGQLNHRKILLWFKVNTTMIKGELILQKKYRISMMSRSIFMGEPFMRRWLH